MITDSEEIVPIPYEFTHKEKRTILAFAGDKELQDLAIQSGAEIAVGPDIIKKVFYFKNIDIELFRSILGQDILE